ncbi:glutamine amidotransferase-related protein [Endozoicomonas arenosclerae]|uniref:glutamine amidotransferase-related protein n=1 Tax=Endozoicomonas arenosclerae TaxID=1633495 RepID=UPI0007810BBA|nr:glutamine amidotransferase [Endozoicomonas arenosclerae]
MKVGLLLCDDVTPVLQKAHKNYPDMFLALLRKQEPELEMVTYRVLDGELPENTSECDCWIISGSRHSAYDSFSWISLLEVFVRKLYEDRCKLAGICFGHQVMANSLGGKVELAEKGWGVGMSYNRITQESSWMQPAAQDFKLLVSHRDQVTHLPSSAKVLASSDFCPNYMLQYGDCFLSIQGHPEFSKSYSADLMNSRRESIPEDRILKGMDSLTDDPDSDLIAQWIMQFFRQKL